MHADRTNRGLLSMLGLLLLAAGITGILAGTDAFARNGGNRHLLDNPVGRYIGDNQTWFWLTAAAVAAILALLALRWFAAVLRPAPRTADIELAVTTPGHGRTTLESAALRDALTTEINGYRDVDHAHIQVLGNLDAPRLTVTVHATRDADLAALRHRLQTQALAHARQALDAADLPVRLDLAVAKQPTSRVT